MRLLLFSATIGLGLAIVASCTQPNNGESSATTTSAENLQHLDAAQLATGLKLLETNCYSCHSPSADMGNRVAPPMEAVKRHYLDEDTTEAEFTQAVVAFLQNPTIANTKMHGAVKRFGVMPQMNFPEDQLQAIAAYMYHADLEKPDWFEAHFAAEHGKSGTGHHGLHHERDTALSPLELGQRIAMQTKATLGKNLLGAINSRGAAGAVDFCSTRAIPITDSMALALNASVKRVSDRNRNPDNAANADELAYIQASKALLAQGKKLMPKLTEIDGMQVGYYPIMTNTMCLQCHGQQGSQIADGTAQVIAAKYPEDKAVGYASDELRGIWVVEMQP
jgi:mono/diheme cytochrome c family protein